MRQSHQIQNKNTIHSDPQHPFIQYRSSKETYLEWYQSMTYLTHLSHTLTYYGRISVSQLPKVLNTSVFVNVELFWRQILESALVVIRVVLPL